jgi:hypothetical protein
MQRLKTNVVNQGVSERHHGYKVVLFRYTPQRAFSTPYSGLSVPLIKHQFNATIF